MTRRTTLARRLAWDLRAQIAAGDPPAGSRLATETALAERFGMSRPTVRAALRELETLGLVRTHHGVGTFVVEQPAVRAGLERLESITESIRATGKEPGMTYASRMRRGVLPEEAASMRVPGDTEVLELRRTILAAPRDDPGSPATLGGYAARRRPDRWAGVAFTHGLVHLFGTDLPFVRWPRGLGLALLDAAPPLKRSFTRAMLFGA